MLDFAYFNNEQSQFIIKELEDAEGKCYKYFVTVGPLDPSKQVKTEVPMTFTRPYSQD